MKKESGIVVAAPKGMPRNLPHRALRDARRLAIVGLLVLLLALAACQGDDEPIVQAIQILDGATVLTTSSVVDFGSASNSGSHSTKTFTLANVGSAELTVTLPVAIGGTDPTFFAVIADPAVTVVGGGSTTFDVDFPTAMDFGVVKTASVTVTSNDPDTSNFTFGVTGIANS